MSRGLDLLPKRLKNAIKKRLIRIETAQNYDLIVDPSSRELVGKTAVITGASGAIGRAIAIQLAVSGARVIAIGRDTAKLDALVAEIEGLGGVALSESLDITDLGGVKSLAVRLGHIDILINNAGGSSRSKHGYIWELDPATIDEVLNVNLRATMFVTAAFGASMIGSKDGGRIVNLGSTVARGGLSKFSEYAAAKSGVVGFTRSAALEFGNFGITVNCVTPGIVQRGQVTPEQIERVISKGVLPQMGRPTDIAEMVGFLVSPRAGWITGQEFVVDGGRSIGLHGES